MDKDDLTAGLDKYDHSGALCYDHCQNVLDKDDLLVVQSEEIQAIER